MVAVDQIRISTVQMVQKAKGWDTCALAPDTTITRAARQNQIPDRVQLGGEAGIGRAQHSRKEMIDVGVEVISLERDVTEAIEAAAFLVPVECVAAASQANSPSASPVDKQLLGYVIEFHLQSARRNPHVPSGFDQTPPCLGLGRQVSCLKFLPKTQEIIGQH